MDVSARVRVFCEVGPHRPFADRLSWADRSFSYLRALVMEGLRVRACALGGVFFVPDENKHKDDSQYAHWRQVEHTFTHELSAKLLVNMVIAPSDFRLGAPKFLDRDAEYRPGLALRDLHTNGSMNICVTGLSDEKQPRVFTTDEVRAIKRYDVVLTPTKASHQALTDNRIRSELLRPIETAARVRAICEELENDE